MGLREQISKSVSVDEINALLGVGSKYEYASMQTRSAWMSTAKQRAEQLKGDHKALVEIKKINVSQKNLNKKSQKKKRHA